jgi:uracil phosphoribosyltransferase
MDAKAPNVTVIDHPLVQHKLTLMRERGTAVVQFLPTTTMPIDKVPEDLQERLVVVIDPMLATGNSAVAAVSRLKENGAQQIKFVCLLAAPEGIARCRGLIRTYRSSLRRSTSA